ncbi:MAG: YkgJ family cysteine cluster protein [Eubacteriales bacterium]|nr:YkgJ family cysteine cluster protein [Eubacteriales bacterium]
MRREVTLADISDGRLYDSNDMVKADCQDCKGCCDCCKGMGDTVVLDPYDVVRMAGGLGKTTEQLIAEDLELGVQDGNILPHLKMKAGAEERCTFLNDEGRCSIHSVRPGICRLFPLGRFYEDHSYKYFLQIYECKKTNRTKVKARKWIDTPNTAVYERFIGDWHYFLLDTQEIMERMDDEQLSKNLNLYILRNFYLKPYHEDGDFYEQFYQRLQEAKNMLGYAPM